MIFENSQKNQFKTICIKGNTSQRSDAYESLKFTLQTEITVCHCIHPSQDLRLLLPSV